MFFQKKQSSCRGVKISTNCITYTSDEKSFYSGLLFKKINMKKLIPFVLAGMMGGMLTLGLFFFFSSQDSNPQDQNNFAQQVNQPINIKAGANAVPFDFTEAAEMAMPAVVHISAAESETMANKRKQDSRSSDPFRFFFGDEWGGGMGGPQIKRGTGSGVIYSQDGYIVTNNHVVEFADEVEVTLFDNRQYNAKIIGKDPKTDLAVLKIEANDLPTLKSADSDLAKVGQWVLAVGNPFDLTSTVTAGIISAKGRDINIIDRRDAIEAFIQTDAAVNPGNSGGALVDAQGRLLGINTAIATRTGSFAGYSFAIPVNMMSKIVTDIIEYGSYQRGYLGISIMDLDSDEADNLGLAINQGVVVKGLEEASAAELAGIIPNDVIVAANGKTVKTAPELQEIVGRAKVGETVELTINRNGRTKNIPVVLKKAG